MKPINLGNDQQKQENTWLSKSPLPHFNLMHKQILALEENI
jgi:hypothetical protein